MTSHEDKGRLFPGATWENLFAMGAEQTGLNHCLSSSKYEEGSLQMVSLLCLFSNHITKQTGEGWSLRDPARINRRKPDAIELFPVDCVGKRVRVQSTANN